MKAVRGVILVALIAWVGATAAATVTMPHPADLRSESALQRQDAPAGGVARTSAAALRPTPAQAAPPTLSAAQLKTTLDRYCLSCHSDRLKTGGLTLENIDYTKIPGEAERLEKVLQKLRVGAMPPAGLPRPDDNTYHLLVSELESQLDRAAAAKPDPGPAILRRLNRTEYANAIRDLLALDVDAASMLPPDDSSSGFDNVADVLGISPSLMEGYLTAARKISVIAIGDASEIPRVDETFAVPPTLAQDQHLEGMPEGTRGGMLVAAYHFPVDAEYELQALLRESTTGMFVGFEYPHEVIFTIDGMEVRRATVGGHEALVKNVLSETITELQEEVAKGLTFKWKIPAGPHAVGVTFVQKSRALSNYVLKPGGYILPQDYTGIPKVRALKIAGPFNVTGPGDTLTRRRIFTCRPTGSADEARCAREILTALAQRAYRRPLAQGDVPKLMSFYQMGRAKGTFDAAVGLGLRAILASPDFVLRIERNPPNVAEGAVYRVPDTDLASRLSFFLWSTIPDAELTQVASQGRLKDPVVFERQVRRMLADPKARALVDNFAGQWLQLRNLRGLVFGSKEFPEFDDDLREASLKEMQMFFEGIIREDRSVLDLLNGNYTFVNERLARHYGLRNVYGSEFQRVTLENNEERWGLLGKGALLMVTALPTRTSPVTRGYWILDKLLGMPPPPPPPNVDTNLKDNRPGDKPLTLRQRMEAHRANPTCAGCHRRMDPLGFAMEYYDGLGKWRTKDEGIPVDGSGQWLDGTVIDGPVALRRALLKDPQVFVHTMTEKLMTYALGRGVSYRDMPVVRAVTAAAARDNYRFSSLVRGIVQSAPFRMRVAQQVDGESARRDSGKTVAFQN